MRTDPLELLAVGISGRASLVGRIETLLMRGSEFSPRASLTRIAASTAMLPLFAAAGTLTSRWIAFAQQSSGPAFEVASIRPTRPATPSTIRYFPGGRIDDQYYIAASIFSALPEQPGLKLESSNKAVEMLVIDHVERPDAN